MPQLAASYEPLEPRDCEQLARRLEGAVAKLRGWGIRISPSSRLPTAVRELRAVASLGAFPADSWARARIGEAIKVAFDFDRITGVIPSPLPEQFGELLRRAVKGSLDATRPADHRRIQSQLLVGTMLVAGRLPTRVPPSGGSKSPDFIVTVDDLEFCVEVKRPEGESGIEPNLSGAAGQLEDHGCRHSALAFDLSDCLPRRADGVALEDFEQQSARTFRLLADSLDGLLAERYVAEPYSRVAFLAILADTFAWIENESSPHPYARLRFNFIRGKGLPVTLIRSQTDKVVVALVEGMERLGARMISFRRLR